MKKKWVAIAAVVVLILGLSTTAFAAAAAPGAGYGYGCGGTVYSLMCGDDGNFLSREAFEANLDKAIEDGIIRSEDRGFFLERYDYCAENGGGAYGMRGCCGTGNRWAS